MIQLVAPTIGRSLRGPSLWILGRPWNGGKANPGCLRVPCCWRSRAAEPGREETSWLNLVCIAKRSCSGEKSTVSYVLASFRCCKTML